MKLRQMKNINAFNKKLQSERKRRESRPEEGAKKEKKPQEQFREVFTRSLLMMISNNCPGLISGV